ncbi:hypothetical protein [Vibrio fluvialis]|uniref:hypothetical protein n=1 Tax=Vibrio fluvialis TaxID=676 RepID=UPI001C9CDE8C|nr:hypothetical protein [Vibrio fluvialis]MBY7922845.1 hypothetical protein [Vibrio fluvialis]MBY7978731.1 hypothetical protein [Vibrio fluvialis]
MSSVKRWMDEQEGARNIATSICIAAGVLTRCEYHDDIILVDSGDEEAAYKYANELFTNKDDLVAGFDSRREMTDAIKDVLSDGYDYECHSCKKWEDD